MDETRRKKFYVKSKYFLKKKIPVHVIKKNNWWNNGLIKEISDDFLILDDEVEGEIPIFFLEIVDILKRRPKK